MNALVADEGRSEKFLLEAERRLATKIVELSPVSIMVTDRNSRILMVNPAFTRVTGYSADEMLGQSPHVLSSGRQKPGFYTRMWRDLLEQGYWEGELWNRRKNGDEYPEWLAITALHDHQGEIEKFIAVFTDISQHKQAEQRLEHMAHHDHLTGLPNRLALMDRLERDIKRARRHRSLLAVLFIDLNQFKPVNDRYGHGEGDAVLQCVGQRLRQCVREVDVVGRMGGDEFVVVLGDLRERTVIARIARKMLGVLEAPIGSRQHRIGASIGVAVYPGNGDSAESLINAADTAMYAAKAGRSSRFMFFDELLPEQRTALSPRTPLDDPLSAAVHANLFQAELLCRTADNKKNCGDLALPLLLGEGRGEGNDHGARDA
ncbi:MAG: sensor domain-containing diguanylate cyclase [Methylococcaceae bacterium]|nr:MAG: sensor domain-containing diguanylate cyclase [Methylococcaceae bacterium]